MKPETEFFKNLYLRAKHSFNECVLNPDNDFLKDEINTSVSEITLKDDFIRLRFFEDEDEDQNQNERFVVEVKLQLISADHLLIGRYYYYEDERKTPLDDRLIFD